MAWIQTFSRRSGSAPRSAFTQTAGVAGWQSTPKVALLIFLAFAGVL
jgi:hypothetical protein